MKLFSKINWTLFIISFSVGMFICYIFTPKPQIVIKFPTPENSNDVIYVNNAKNCYKYKANEVDCPGDPSKISKPDIN